MEWTPVCSLPTVCSWHANAWIGPYANIVKCPEAKVKLVFLVDQFRPNGFDGTPE